MRKNTTCLKRIFSLMAPGTTELLRQRENASFFARVGKFLGRELTSVICSVQDLATRERR